MSSHGRKKTVTVMVMMVPMTKRQAANSFVGVAPTPSRRTVSSSLLAMPPTPPAVADDHVHPAVVLPAVQVKDEETVPVLLRAVTPEDVVSFSQDKTMERSSYMDKKNHEMGKGNARLVLECDE